MSREGSVQNNLSNELQMWNGAGYVFYSFSGPNLGEWENRRKRSKVEMKKVDVTFHEQTAEPLELSCAQQNHLVLPGLIWTSLLGQRGTYVLHGTPFSANT